MSHYLLCLCVNGRMQSAPNISGGSQQNSISQTTEAHRAVKKQRQQPKKQNMKWLHTDPPTRSPEISNGCESLLLQSPNLHQCWNPGASRDSRCLESQFIFHFFFIFLVVFLCFKTPIDSSCFGECCEAHLLQLQPTFYQHEGFFG